MVSVQDQPATRGHRKRPLPRRLLSVFLVLTLMTAVLPTGPLRASADAPLTSFSESFENFPALVSSGWVMRNQSQPLGSTTWMQDIGLQIPPQDGAACIYADYQSAADGGNISNWLITPQLTLANGAKLTFYTRTSDAGASASSPDRLEVRMSAAGSNTGSSATDVGDFTTLLLSVNPSLTPGVYPGDWAQYTVTLSGLSAPVTGRLAFRYFVTDTGVNGNMVALDSVSYSAEPTVSAVQSLRDVNSGYVVAGDVIECTDTVTNAAGGPAGAAALSYTLPAGTTYVPGSLSVVSGANAGTKTDAAGDDQAEYIAAGNQIVFRLGAGAGTAAGGTLSAGDTTVVRYQVTVNADAPAAIPFLGSLSYQNAAGNGEAVSTNPLQLTVSPTADVAVTVTADNAAPQKGDAVNLTVSVTNSGPGTANSVSVLAPLPSGLAFVSAAPSVAYDRTSGLWTVGNLAPGATQTLVIGATASSTGAQTLTASAGTSSNDPSLANNSASATVNVTEIIVPSYTITIPESISLAYGDTSASQYTVQAQGVHLESGAKLTVTASGSGTSGAFSVTNGTDTVGYELSLTNSPWAKLSSGGTITQFTGNGSAGFYVKAPDFSAAHTAGHFSGNVVFQVTMIRTLTYAGISGPSFAVATGNSSASYAYAEYFQGDSMPHYPSVTWSATSLPPGVTFSNGTLTVANVGLDYSQTVTLQATSVAGNVRTKTVKIISSATPGTYSIAQMYALQNGSKPNIDFWDATAPVISQISLFAFNFAPRNWASCDGQILSIQQNTALFSLLGIAYGGNGISTFALPNLNGNNGKPSLGPYLNGVVAPKSTVLNYCINLMGIYPPNSGNPSEFPITTGMLPGNPAPQTMPTVYMAVQPLNDAMPCMGEVVLLNPNDPYVSMLISNGQIAPCQGQTMQINTNQALFALLGITYGGNGVNNFALPDLRGQSPVLGMGYYIATNGIFPSRN